MNIVAISKLSRFKTHLWIVFFLIFFIILRIPSLFEPHWYDDEGIYASVAYALEHGKTLYIDIFDNRLPAMYYLFRLATTENRLIFVRILNLLAGIITLSGIYFSCLRLRLKKGTLFALLFAVWYLGSPRLEANIANTENFFLPLTIWAIWFILTPTSRRAFFSGILFGCAFIIKFQPFFTYLAVLTYFLVETKKDLGERFKIITIFIWGFILPVFLTFTFLFFKGNLNEAIRFGLLNNVAYTTYYAHEGIATSTKIFLLIIPLVFTIICYWRKKITASLALLLLLLSFDYFGAILSGRKYEHYLLQTIPTLALLIGYIVNILQSKINTIIKLFICLIFIIVIKIGITIFYQGTRTPVQMPVVNYYKEFLSFITNKPLSESRLPFRFNSEDEKLQIIRKVPDIYHTQNIYFYTNDPWVYDFAHIVSPTFFVSAYHLYLLSGGEERLIADLQKTHPKLVLVDKQEALLGGLETYLNSHYQVEKEDKYYIYYLNNTK